MKLTKIDALIAIILIILAIALRTIFKIGPNIELVTTASLGAGYFLANRKMALLVPLVIMIISDAIIGNTSIFLFTWSAFLITPIIGIFARKISENKKSELLPEWLFSAFVGLGGSLLSVLIFYLWTNFGVVITTTMYPNTLPGLINSYMNALPFLKNQLYGNIIFAPILFTFISLLKNFLENKQSQPAIKTFEV